MKYALGTVFVVAMLGALFFQNAPQPGESNLHYILSSEDNRQSLSFTIVAGICLAAMWWRRMLRN